MKGKVVLGARILLGLIMLIFGANGLAMFVLGKGFIPIPPPPPEMQTIMAGFMATGYLLILVKLLEVVAGTLLLWGKFRNLAITLLGPIVVNILCLHLFAEHSGLPVAIVVTILFGILVCDRWNQLKTLIAKD